MSHSEKAGRTMAIGDNVVPKCPKYLKKLARKEWNRVIKLLFENGTISGLDLAIIAAYCDTFQNWVIASREVEKVGLLRKAANGQPFPNPWYGVLKKERDSLLEYALALGLSPKQREKGGR